MYMYLVDQTGRDPDTSSYPWRLLLYRWPPRGSLAAVDTEVAVEVLDADDELLEEEADDGALEGPVVRDVVEQLPAARVLHHLWPWGWGGDHRDTHGRQNIFQGSDEGSRVDKTGE